MPLSLYNTLSRRKEPFAPLDPKRVRMYVCGPTVYDFAHIGNARPVIVFDVLYRLLRAEYGPSHVQYVRNITDVDDKINAAARENGESIRDLTTRTAKAFHADVAALGCLPPDAEPRATDHIKPMIDMIEKLINSKHAYEAEGHVLFSVPSMKDYGKLSRRDRDDMIAGARVEVAPYKRDPADFVLWKPSPADLPGWDSPWGRGRPGWHIECSAMSEEFLGESFDIHGGGLDLIFPHHENEIAQSECAHPGKPFVKYWLHNGFVTVNGEKMAKSAGNFRTIRDVLSKWHGETIRLFMLKTYYRSPFDFTDEGLYQAKSDLDRLYKTLLVQAFEQPELPPDPSPILTALEDDLNTPLAISKLHDVASALRVESDPVRKTKLKRTLFEGGRILGLFNLHPAEWAHWIPPAERGLEGDINKLTNEPAWIEEQIAQRNAARKNKDFTGADRIRQELASRGILLEDKPGGKTEWRRG
jgi:cysteinyl-tRNA synthetase